MLNSVSRNVNGDCSRCQAGGNNKSCGEQRKIVLLGTTRSYAPIKQLHELFLWHRCTKEHQVQMTIFITGKIFQSSKNANNLFTYRCEHLWYAPEGSYSDTGYLFASIKWRSYQLVSQCPV